MEMSSGQAAKFQRKGRNRKRHVKAFAGLGLVDSKVPRLEESAKRAVGTLLPKVEVLLSGRNAVASSPAPSPTAAASSVSLLALAERGDGEALLRILADSRVDVLSNPPRTGNGDTILHVAASGGHMKAVMVLLGAGVQVDVLGHRLRTPLHCAAAHGHLAVTQRLLYAGAKVDVKDANGGTALELAAGEGYKEVVCLLLEHDAKADKNFASFVISQGNKKMVELFVEKGLSVDACNGDGEPLLVQAAKAKHWEIVDMLLEKGASSIHCKADKECALVLASQDGQADVVRHLLRRGATSNTEQVKWALMNAKSGAVVWAFVDAVGDQVRGEAGRWGLLEAACRGRLEPVGALLEAGVPIDVKDYSNQTALFLASANGHVACVKKLVRRGADVNAVNHDGNTPLHRASVFGFVGCVRVLCAAGANTSARNNEGKTPLDVANTKSMRRAFNFH